MHVHPAQAAGSPAHEPQQHARRIPHLAGGQGKPPWTSFIITAPMDAAESQHRSTATKSERKLPATHELEFRAYPIASLTTEALLFTPVLSKMVQQGFFETRFFENGNENQH